MRASSASACLSRLRRSSLPTSLAHADNGVGFLFLDEVLAFLGGDFRLSGEALSLTASGGFLALCASSSSSPAASGAIGTSSKEASIGGRVGWATGATAGEGGAAGGF